jgi:hypothetical protein
MVTILVALSQLDYNLLSRASQYKNEVDCSVDGPKAQESWAQSQSSDERIISELHQQQKRLSDEEISRVVAGYERGLTVYELAEQFGCHRITISNHLKANGVKMRRISPSDEQIDQMIALYQSGLSLLNVGDKFDMSATTVLRQLQKRGAEMRDLHGRAK